MKCTGTLPSSLNLNSQFALFVFQTGYAVLQLLNRVPKFSLLSIKPLLFCCDILEAFVCGHNTRASLVSRSCLLAQLSFRDGQFLKRLPVFLADLLDFTTLVRQGIVLRSRGLSGRAPILRLEFGFLSFSKGDLLALQLLIQFLESRLLTTNQDLEFSQASRSREAVECNLMLNSSAKREG